MNPHLSSAEIVIMDGCGIYTEVVKHLVDSRRHRTGAAHVILYLFRLVLVLKVGVVYDLMHESGRIFDTCGIGGRLGTVKRAMELEVGVLFFELQEIVQIEPFV